MEWRGEGEGRGGEKREGREGERRGRLEGNKPLSILHMVHCDVTQWREDNSLNNELGKPPELKQLIQHYLLPLVHWALAILDFILSIL